MRSWTASLSFLLLPAGIGKALAAARFAAAAVTPAAAVLARADPASDDSVGSAAVACMFRDLGDRRLFARATLVVLAPPQAVYDVVADYERIADYMSAVDTSRVLERDSTGVLLRQVGRTRYILARTVRLVLRTHEEPPHRVRFEIVSGDFDVYYGAWSLEPQARGTRLEYSATMRPPAYVPMWVARRILERDLRAHLPEIAAEVERRLKSPKASRATPGSPR